MGLSPEQVLALPLHDYQAAIYHFNRSQGGDDEAGELSESEFDDMLAGLDSAGIH